LQKVYFYQDLSLTEKSSIHDLVKKYFTDKVNSVEEIVATAKALNEKFVNEISNLKKAGKTLTI